MNILVQAPLPTAINVSHISSGSLNGQITVLDTSLENNLETDATRVSNSVTLAAVRNGAITAYATPSVTSSNASGEGVLKYTFTIPATFEVGGTTTIASGDFILIVFGCSFSIGETTYTVPTHYFGMSVIHDELDAADAVWDELLTGATHNIATSAGRRLRNIEAGSILLEEDTAQGGTADTITLSTNASSTNDHYKTGIISITSGTGAAQSRTIKSYVGSTRVATICTPWATNPDATSTYIIQSSGCVGVYGIADNAITADVLADGAATKIADAVDVAVADNFASDVANSVWDAELTDSSHANANSAGKKLRSISSIFPGALS